MKKILLALILLFPFFLFGQKIKVKKGVISVDGNAYAKIEKVKKGKTKFTIDNQDDQLLYSFDLHLIRPYEKGPALQYWRLSTPAANDTVTIDYREYYNAKRIAKFLTNSNLVEANQANVTAFAELKQTHPQDLVETFLADNELTLTKLVRRFPNSKTAIDDMFAEKMQLNKKYYVVSGNGYSKQTIGYYIIEEHEGGDRPLLKLGFYLPNDLELANIMFEGINSRNFTRLRTLRDKTNHRFTTNLSVAGIQKAINFLVSAKYL